MSLLSLSDPEKLPKLSPTYSHHLLFSNKWMGPTLPHRAHKLMLQLCRYWWPYWQGRPYSSWVKLTCATSLCASMWRFIGSLSTSSKRDRGIWKLLQMRDSCLSDWPTIWPEFLQVHDQERRVLLIRQGHLQACLNQCRDEVKGEVAKFACFREVVSHEADCGDVSFYPVLLPRTPAHIRLVEREYTETMILYSSALYQELKFESLGQA